MIRAFAFFEQVIPKPERCRSGFSVRRLGFPLSVNPPGGSAVLDSKRNLIHWGFIILLTLVLTGCSSLPALPNLPWQATPVPSVHLNAWLPTTGEEDATFVREQVNTLIAASNAISMTVTLLEERPRTLTQLLDNDPSPDLLEIDLFSLPQLVEAGQLAAYPASMAPMDGFHPRLRQAVTINGAVYCLPKDVHTLGLFYNQTLFDTAELTYPNESWTWAELINAAEAIGGLPSVEFTPFGLALGADVSRWLPLYLQAGGDWTPETGLDPTALQSAMTHFQTLYSEGLAITPNYYGRSWSGPVFGNGRVGMVFEGNWLADYLAEEFPNLAYGVAPLPSGPSGPATLAFGDCYAVNAQSEQQSHAFALAAQLASDEAMAKRLVYTAALPARTATGVAWEATYPHLRALRTQLDNATIWQSTPSGQATIDAAQRTLTDLLEDDLTVEEAVNEVLQVKNE